MATATGRTLPSGTVWNPTNQTWQAANSGLQPQGDVVYNPAAKMFVQTNQAIEAQQNASRTGSVYTPNYYQGGSGASAPLGSKSTMSGGGAGGYTNPGPSGEIVNSPGSGGGNINLSRPGYESQQAMELRAKLANQAFDRVLGASGGNGAGARVNYGNDGADEAARAAAFARAKETAGLNANAALKSIQDVTSRGGLRGSSIAGGMEAAAVNGGRGDIANFITNQLQDELGHIQHVSDTTYQGNIAQRGQDTQAKQALLSILAGLY